MNIRSTSEVDSFAINVIPMVDILFLLLIFFMLATTFMDPERSLDVELPTASSPTTSSLERQEIVLNVLQDGRIVLDGHDVTRPELLDILKGAAARDPSTPVTIRGHRQAMHQAIVGVMDACGIAGLSNLSVGTTPEERG